MSESKDNTMLAVCHNASFGYDGHVVIQDLNFSVEDGDFLCITGENGSGKTTLLRGLLRLLSPMEGTLNFNPDLKQTAIGYLSQEAIAKKDFPAGVFEIALSGNLGKMGLRPFYTSAEKRRADETLLQLGIADLKKSCFRELSGGQQRRVLLARSLCAAQQLLVLDEPFAGLDPLISAELYQLLKKINQEMGMTIIMVSHDIEIADCASHALHVQKKQVFFGSMDQYRQSEIGQTFFAKRRENND